ncbi:prokineticin-1 isoform 2-T2 [Spheniscus humboldti]
MLAEAPRAVTELRVEAASPRGQGGLLLLGPIRLPRGPMQLALRPPQRLNLSGRKSWLGFPPGCACGKLSTTVQACERDPQCGSGTCCAVSLWLRGLRMCTPLGQEGDECHPFSHKVPFFGKRQHHTCPCLPNFICSRFLDGRYRCSIDFKNVDF